VTATLVQLPLIPETPPALGDMALIPVDRLPPDDQLEGEPYPALTDSIRRWGVFDPVVVRAVGGALDYGNPKTLVAGRRRIKTVRLLQAEARAHLDKLARLVPAGTVLSDETLPGYRAAYERFRALQRIPVRVVSDPEGTLDDGRTEALAVMTNAVRQDNPATDFRSLCFLVARLVAEGQSEKGAIAEVARATGLATGTIKQRLRLLALSPDLQDDFMAGRLPYSVALHASRLGPESQALFASMVDGGQKPTLELVKQAKRDAVKQHQADLFADLPEAPVEESGGEGGDGDATHDDLIWHAERLRDQLGQIKMPIMQEAAGVIHGLLKLVQERLDG